MIMVVAAASVSGYRLGKRGFQTREVLYDKEELA